MKIKNITDIDGFFKVIDSCQGKVELITGEGDRLNLKSKLCQYVSLTSILKTDVEIPELELVAYEPAVIFPLRNPAGVSCCRTCRHHFPDAPVQTECPHLPAVHRVCNTSVRYAG